MIFKVDFILIIESENHKKYSAFYLKNHNFDMFHTFGTHCIL